MTKRDNTQGASSLGWIGLVWGLGGILAILLFPIYRLSFIAAEAFSFPLTALHWIVGGGWVVFMLYAEGWRGFHCAWAPRTAARARFLLYHPTALRVLMAPLFCMCFFHASRKRQIVAWVLTLSIIALIVLIRWLPQPWRGLVDLGVVAGLSVGTLSLLFFVFQSFSRPAEDVLPGMD